MKIKISALILFLAITFYYCSDSGENGDIIADSSDSGANISNDAMESDTDFMDGRYDLDIISEDSDQTSKDYKEITDGVINTDILSDTSEDIVDIVEEDILAKDVLQDEDIILVQDTYSDVADTGTPYVNIVSPADGATVKNPVVFKFTYSKVSKVRFFADNYPLGAAFDPQGTDTFTYNFSGTGYERNILLEGYDASGNTVASDSIKITVEDNENKGELIGKMYNTYYYLAYEASYSGADDTTLYDSNCKPIADVPYKFSDAVCIEGSGKLEDGRVINYAETCNCGRKCAGYNYIVCYTVLDPNKYPWGMGSKGNPLVPLRSWATDNAIIPYGTILYIEEWDGVLIPDVDGIGNFVHDGCFRSDDIGGAIQGMHFDFFAGTASMWKALEKIYPTKTYFNVYKNNPKCSYLKN